MRATSGARNRPGGVLLFLCVLGGALLLLSQPPGRFYALQMAAFVPFLWALGTTPSPQIAALCGAAFGLSYAIPILIIARLPAIVGAILLLSQTLTWIVFGLLAARFAALSPLWGALAMGAAATFLVWGETALLPLWGSAQNFARAWSAAPRAVGFASTTGITGAVWALVTLQALVVNALKSPQNAPMLLGVAAAIVAVLTLTNEVLWRQNSGKTLVVATLGWADNAFDVTNLNGDYARQVEIAAQTGAKLIVSPEAAFRVAQRDTFRLAAQALAAQHRVHLAIGYFDQARNCNCIDFVTPDGEIADRYLKTHLVPVYETYVSGRGRRACIKINGARAGGMICQDDNFSDIARGYGRDGTQILAIPTNDWDRVARFHWSNSLWRAIENRYAIARATSDGISSIQSARGEVRASCDHFQDGFQMLLCEVAIGNGRPTIYARWGDWLPVGCGVAALVATLWA